MAILRTYTLRRQSITDNYPITDFFEYKTIYENNLIQNNKLDEQFIEASDNLSVTRRLIFVDQATKDEWEQYVTTHPLFASSTANEESYLTANNLTYEVTWDTNYNFPS